MMWKEIFSLEFLLESFWNKFKSSLKNFCFQIDIKSVKKFLSFDLKTFLDL